MRPPHRRHPGFSEPRQEMAGTSRCLPGFMAHDLGGRRSMTLFSRLLYSAIAGALLLASILLMAVAISRTFTGFWTGEGALDTMLDGIGLVIIAVAVADVGKFLFEEEVIADRELRRPAEARGSLTKFMTIIIVALSLESLVLITKAARDKPADILFPSLLMLVAVAALVGLGLFQKLSQHATAAIPDDVGDDEDETAPDLPKPSVTRRRKPKLAG
jgi:hypothetical protein